MTIEGQTWTIKATVKVMITRDDLIIPAKNRARTSTGHRNAMMRCIGVPGKLRRLLTVKYLSFLRPSCHSHHQLSLPSPQSIMSAVPSTSTSHFDFESIFSAALETYKRKTDKDLTSHPLLPSLQYCDSPEAILTVLREQIPTFSRSQSGDDGLTKWVIPTVNVLYAFSTALGQGVGLVNIKVFLREEFLL